MSTAQQESLGLFQATGIIFSSITQLAVNSVNMLLPATKAVENIAKTAELHSNVLVTKAEAENVEAMAELTAKINETTSDK